MAWETIIGLEVHAQLKTESKLFSGAPVTFGGKPNTQTSFIDAGFPGVLPVVNQRAVEMAICFGLAINAEINNNSYFERKNYFYPDLPKGYQISQNKVPLVSNGRLLVKLENNAFKEVVIVRAHLEEDAGKSLHSRDSKYTGIDLNRAGTPLLEIVTAPCLTSAEEAVAYLKSLHRLVRFLRICDGNMQEGSFRCDVNISLRPKGNTALGTRTELKNLNSFRFIEKAIHYEQARHQDLLNSGQSITQETRLFCPDTNTTQAMRSKENENDYRYFPDPDLLPIYISADDINKVKQSMPELPEHIEARLKNNLTDDDIQFLLTAPANFNYFSELKTLTSADDKAIVNWLKGSYTRALNEANLNFETAPISATALAPLLTLLAEQTISHQMAKQIFTQLWVSSESVEEIIRRENYLHAKNDFQLEQLIKTLIAQYPQQATEYRNGKEKLLAFFIGKTMKETKGQADPEETNRLLKYYLNPSSSK